MSEQRKKKRQEWVDLLSSTDAALVQSPDILGIVADFLLPMVHLFQQTEGVNVIDGGTTCTFDSRPRLTAGWLNCLSREPMLPHDEAEFSILVHESPSSFHVPYGVCIAVTSHNFNSSHFVAPIVYGSVRLFSDQDIRIGTSTDQHVARRANNEPPWPDKTIVTVRLNAFTVTFIINGKHLATVDLPRGPTQWWPAVGIHNVCRNSFSFV